MQLDTETASAIMKSAAQCNAVAEEATRRVVELMQRVAILEAALREIAGGEISGHGEIVVRTDSMRIAHEALEQPST